MARVRSTFLGVMQSYGQLGGFGLVFFPCHGVPEVHPVWDAISYALRFMTRVRSANLEQHPCDKIHIAHNRLQHPVGQFTLFYARVRVLFFFVSFDIV